MDTWTKYVIATWLYALCAITGFALFVWFTVVRNWYMAILAILFAAVALDNVFCGSRLRTAGCAVHGHYASPLRARRPKA